jgi:hypothetical protein
MFWLAPGGFAKLGAGEENEAPGGSEGKEQQQAG